MTETVRVGDPDPTPELDDVSEYCFTPRWLGERMAYCCWKIGHEGDHVSADIGAGVVAVWSGSALPEGRVWAPADRRPWVMGPEWMSLSPAAWTDAMTREARETGVNRQCSIGWHNECSDPDGERCKCACHAADS